MRIYVRSRTLGRLISIRDSPFKYFIPLNTERIVSRFYSHQTGAFTSIPLDQKWTGKWNLHRPRRHVEGDGEGKYFALSMIPYPSGNLHIGHLRVYTISDVLARYRRMKGYNVVHAMGWDAFGLPAENAAIERGIDPAVWTYSNIENMKRQMNSMFADFDWEREFISCSPEYYKWTQALFLKLYNAGLAYRKEALVNWDPVEQTVLANEQVDADGRSWRSGVIAEKKMLSQWFLGITKFAPQLLDHLDMLEEWPDRVKSMQTHWLGRSKGAEVLFPSEDDCYSLITFTTRPDTLFGVQYVAISLNHPLVEKLVADKAVEGLEDFLAKAKELSDDTKLGFKIPNFFVSNPIVDANNFNVPVFVAPYVVDDYGHGTVMGCPGHDTRDLEFWQQNSPGASVVQVITAPGNHDDPGAIYTGKQGHLNEKSGIYSGLSSAEGGEKIVQYLEDHGYGKHSIQWRLRDWLISRQRFWGAPIPMIHCDSCGIVPVPEDQLPVLLPESLGAPLASSEEFKETTCPECGGPAHRDTDTMDTFMDSSWYFFRYSDPLNENKMFSHKAASDLMPVDIYIGGIEHAILHLLYARFISMFLHVSGEWSGGDLDGEPIRRLVTQGMVHGKTYIDPVTGRFLKPDEIELSNEKGDSAVIKSSGDLASIAYEKMSKSKFNGADPGDCIAKHGADATRAHILFQAPVNDVLNWDESKIVGIKRWLSRAENATKAASKLINDSKSDNIKALDLSDSSVFDKLQNESDRELWRQIHPLYTSISESLHETLSLNTVISDYMKLTRLITNALANEQSPLSLPMLIASVQVLLKVIAPVVPATAEECWEVFQKSQSQGEVPSIFLESWPEVVQPPTKSITSMFSVMINGKRRFMVAGDSTLAGNVQVLTDLVKRAPEYSKWLEGHEVESITAKGRAVMIKTRLDN